MVAFNTLFRPENLVALIVLLALILYTATGGADFGSGIWTALASGPRARQQRESLFNAIAPIWETNHVWLIFVVVTLFTAFPMGFRALFIALLVPFVIALIGINFRGAAFAFRHFGRESGSYLPATGQVFSVSSALTPLTMGMAVTAVAAGRIQIQNGAVLADLWLAWITPFTLVGGLIGLALCAFLTPIYMTVRTGGGLQEDFRSRGLAAALVLGGLTSFEIPVALFDAPQFAGRLFQPLPIAIIVLAVISGVSTLLTLYRRSYLWAQVTAIATVTFTLAGFATALYPDLIIGELSIAEAAAPEPTLLAYLIAMPIGALILIPSLALLYWTFRGEPAH